MTPDPRKRLLRYTLLAVVLSIAAAYWIPLRFSSLMGDDFLVPELVTHVPSDGLWSVITFCLGIGIFRPLLMLLIVARSALTGPHYEVYFYGNLAMELTLGAVVFGFLTRRSGSVWIATALTLLFVLHHAHFYSVLVATGEQDLIPNLVFVGLVAVLLRHLDRPSRRTFAALLAVFAVLVFCRENFLFVAPLLMACALWTRDGLSLPRLRDWRTWLLSLSPLVVAAVYLLARRSILGHLSTKVPGAQVTFEPLAFAKSFGIFFLDLFGVFLNEPWFVGIAWADTPWMLRAIELFWLVACLALIAFYFLRAEVDRATRQRGILFGLLMLAMLAPSSLIHKHDLKYLGPSVIALVLLLADAANAVFTRRRSQGIAAAAAMTIVATTSYFYHGHIDGAYFASASHCAESLKRLTVDRLGENLRDYRIYLQVDPSIEWAVLHGRFFNVYLRDPSFPVVRFAAYNEIDPDTDKLLVMGVNPINGAFRDVTTLAVAEARRHRVLRWDALRNFDAGHVEPDTAISSTPNNRGAFLNAFAGSDESPAPEESLTITTGYTWRSAPLTVASDDRLDATYRMPLSDTDGAALRVDIRDARGVTHTLFDATDLRPGPSWSRTSVDLHLYVGQQVSIAATVYSPSGDANGDWVALKSLDLVSKPSTSQRDVGK